MKDDFIVAARKRAEAAVEGMADEGLKIAAFQTILSSLLQGQGREPQPRSQSQKESASHGVRGELTVPTKKGKAGTTSRLIAMVHSGFFSQPKSLAEIQQGLAERGYHYPLTHLGTPLRRLVRAQALRRAQATSGGKKVWRYSQY